MKNKIDLYTDDCFNIFPNIENNTIDLILCDLPYGITDISWDAKLPLPKLWKEYIRILKDNGNIVLFSSGNFTIDLINSNRELYKYKLIWKKNTPTGMNFAKVRPMKYYEEICVFNNGKAIYNPIMKPRENIAKHSYNYNHYNKNNYWNNMRILNRSVY